MIDFPASPVDGQIFAASNGATYQWKAMPGVWVIAAGGVTGSGKYVLQTSPELLGEPLTPTPPIGDDSKKIVNSEFVRNAIISSTGGGAGFHPVTGGEIIAGADYSHFPCLGLLPNGTLGMVYYHGRNHGQGDLQAVCLLQALGAAGNFVINGNEAVDGVATSIPGTAVLITDTAAADNSDVNFTITGTAEGTGAPLVETKAGPNSGQTTISTDGKFATVTNVATNKATDGEVSIGFYIVPGSTAFKSSLDSGKTWSDEIVLFDGLTVGDAQYYSAGMAVTADGEFLVVAYRVDPDTDPPEITMVSRRTTGGGTVWGERFTPTITASPALWGTAFSWGQGKLLSDGTILFSGYTGSSGALVIYKSVDNGQTYTVIKYRDEWELVAKLQTLSAAGNFGINGYYASGGVASIPPPVSGYLVSINQKTLEQNNSGINFTITGTADAIGSPLSVTIPGPALDEYQSFTASNNATAIATAQTLAAPGSFTLDGSFASGGVATAATPLKVSINDELANNNSVVSFVVAGENPLGTAINEILVGPSAAQTTVYTKKTFLKVTNVASDSPTAGPVSIGFKGYLFWTVTNVAASAATDGEVSVGWNVPNTAEPALEILDDDRWITISRMSAVQRMFNYTTSDGGMTWSDPVQIAAASGMPSYGYVSPTLTKYVMDGVTYLRLDANVREATSGIYSPEPSQVAWFGAAETVFADPTAWGTVQIVVDGSNGGPPNIPNNLRGRSGYQSLAINPLTSETLMVYGVEWFLPSDPRKARIESVVSPPETTPRLLGSPVVDSLSVGTGLPAPFGIVNAGTVKRLTGNSVNYNATTKKVDGGSFTVGELAAFRSSGVVPGDGATVTNAYGFHVDNTNVHATVNIGFYGGLDANPGTTTVSINLDTVGVAAGVVTIGLTAPPALPLVIGQTITVTVDPIPATSLVAGAAYYIVNLYNPLVAGSAVTDFKTVGSFSNNPGEYFIATGPATGTGTAVPAVNGSGILIASVPTTTTLTYARAIPDMPSLTVTGTVKPSQRWNIYAAGTAPNLFGGAIFQSSTATGTNMRLSRPISGASQGFGIHNSPQIQSDVTTAHTNFYSVPSVAAGHIVPSLYHYRVIGLALPGATNQYGLHSPIVAGTGQWNVYASGTAANAFNGPTRFGGVTAPLSTVDITGSFARGAPVVKTANFTVGAAENWLVNNKATADCVVTLPAAASFPGRELMFQNVQPFAVLSASANVIPPVGGTLTATILPAVPGASITLVSDGTSWRSIGNLPMPDAFAVTTLTLATAADPSGIQAALNYVASWVPGSNGALAILNAPQGVFEYTVPITVNLPFGMHVMVQGVLGAAATLTANPITAMVKNGAGAVPPTPQLEGSYDITYANTIVPTGTLAGHFFHFKAAASVSGPARMRELAGGHEIISAGLSGVPFKVRLWNAAGPTKDFNTASFIGAAMAFTEVRIVRTVLNFKIVGTGADQGGFTVNGGTLWTDGVVLKGNRTEAGTPTAIGVSPVTTAGSAATAGVLLYPNTHLKAGDNTVICGWGGYGVQALAGSSVDWLDAAIQNCFSVGVYSQQNCSMQMARAVVTGCGKGSATTIGSHGQFASGVFALCGWGAQTIGHASSSFDADCYVGSNIFGHFIEDSYVDASSGVDMATTNNTTNVQMPLTGQIKYKLSGSAVNQINYVGTVASLPAASPGVRLFVTDATLTLAAGLGTVPVGGGANKVPVYGEVIAPAGPTGWRIG